MYLYTHVSVCYIIFYVNKSMYLYVYKIIHNIFIVPIPRLNLFSSVHSTEFITILYIIIIVKTRYKPI